MSQASDKLVSKTAGKQERTATNKLTLLQTEGNTGLFMVQQGLSYNLLSLNVFVT